MAYIQKDSLKFGNHFLEDLFFLVIIKKDNDRIDKTKAATPPNLLGIDRKIA